MGIRFVRNKAGIYDSINCCFLEPCHLLLSEEKIEKYLAEHPFPDDENYSVEELKTDLKSGGSWTLPEAIRDETGEYIAMMIHELL